MAINEIISDDLRRQLKIAVWREFCITLYQASKDGTSAGYLADDAKSWTQDYDAYQEDLKKKKRSALEWQLQFTLWVLTK